VWLCVFIWSWTDVWNIPFIVCFLFKLTHHLRTINILFSYSVIQQRKCSCQIHSVKMPHNEHYCESSHFLDKGGDPPHSSQIQHHLPICRATETLSFLCFPLNRSCFQRLVKRVFYISTIHDLLCNAGAKLSRLELHVSTCWWKLGLWSVMQRNRSVAINWVCWTHWRGLTCERRRHSLLYHKVKLLWDMSQLMEARQVIFKTYTKMTHGISLKFDNGSKACL